MISFRSVGQLVFLRNRHNFSSGARICPLYIYTLKLIFILSIVFGAISDTHADTARFSPYGGGVLTVGILDYVNPEAPRGGTLRLASTLNYDTTNLMRFPGRPPNELRFIFDSLLIRVPNRHATYFGLLAKKIEVSEDFSTTRFFLDPTARWHDGTELTAHDVAFTIRTLAQHGLPSYRQALLKIDVEVIDRHQIEFRTSETGSWRYIDMIGAFPIQSRKYWAARDPSAATLEIPTGSGPYRMTELTADTLALERVAEYWAKDHPLTCGRWNFDHISLDRYFDKSALIEAMKRGDLDLVFETDARAWLHRYDSRALRNGDIQRTAIPRRDAGAMRGLIMNTRRVPLQDSRVRAALILAYDTVWMNDSLGGVEALPGGFYGTTAFAAKGAAGRQERELLAPFSAHVPAGLLDRPGPDFPTERRARLRQANALLDEAGYALSGRWRIHTHTGEPLTLLYVTAHRQTLNAIEPYRQWLERIGIKLEIQVTDLAMGRRLILDHAYDLTWLTWIPALPPGEIERVYWHSDQAAGPGYGLAGASDPAIDAMIDLMQRSVDLEETKAAARALDRLLQWGNYVIPIGHRNEWWFVKRKPLMHPTSGAAPPNPVHYWWWDDPIAHSDVAPWPSCAAPNPAEHRSD